jgi:shikimate kinase
MQEERDSHRSPTKVGTSHGLPFSRIVLTGFMGAGKSTVGQLLSRTMGWAFLDLDQHIESSAGATAKDLFAIRGESAFRKLESDALALALERSETIIALGGAAIDATVNQLLLANSHGTLVVFLDAPFGTLIERCLVQERNGSPTYRPLLHQTEVAHTRFLARRSLYQDHASFTVNVADRSAEEVAFLIWNKACGRLS